MIEIYELVSNWFASDVSKIFYDLQKFLVLHLSFFSFCVKTEKSKIKLMSACNFVVWLWKDFCWWKRNLTAHAHVELRLENLSSCGFYYTRCFIYHHRTWGKVLQHVSNEYKLGWMCMVHLIPIRNRKLCN